MYIAGRIVIENVYPEIDNGLFPIYRIKGDTVTVSADIFAEGHQEVLAFLLFKKENEKTWRKVPMNFVINDKWSAEFTIAELCHYTYTVEAWSSDFLTWQKGFKKKFQYNVNNKIDIASGLALLNDFIKKKPSGILQKFIDKINHAQTIRNKSLFLLDEKLSKEIAVMPDQDSLIRYPKDLKVVAEREKAGFSAWYEFFPRSSAGNGKHGTFKDAEKLLPAISRMGFDVVYLPPIHPIGITNRKGKNNAIVTTSSDPGSPWAVGNKAGGHKAIHPDLGTMEDFAAFVRKAADLRLEVAIDIAFQCSPDHPYVTEHPEWFRKRPDGSVQYAENPPKKYEDIYPIHFNIKNKQELWEELKSIFIFWMEKGIKIFRVDNPHTKPFDFWEWCLSEIKKEYPDAIFLAEAFTRPAVMKYLAKIGFTQSYTYFTWRTGQWELKQYLEELTGTEMKEYFTPNFWPNTPDILPSHLQNSSRQSFIMRFFLAATLSSNYGIYGPAFELCISKPLEDKEEYLDSEKYEIKQWDQDARGNIRDIIKRVNTIRRENPALHRTGNLHFCQSDNEAILSYYKTDGNLNNIILCVVNLNPHQAQDGFIRVPIEDFGINYNQEYAVKELITGDEYIWRNDWNYIALNPYIIPAHVFRITVI